MTSTVLQSDEWTRLDKTGIAAMVATLHPDRSVIVAVEDDGAIVGTWILLSVPHLEGFWIDPSHRGKTTVLRHLINHMKDITEGAGAQVVMTGAESDSVRRMLDRAGATKAPDQFYLRTDWSAT